MCAYLWQPTHRTSLLLRAHLPKAGTRSSVSAQCYFLQVICMDNFFTGSKENIAHLIGKPNFELIRHDVVEPIMLEVDQVYHCACPASPIHYK
jgi:hypothetical protein